MVITSTIYIPNIHLSENKVTRENGRDKIYQQQNYSFDEKRKKKNFEQVIKNGIYEEFITSGERQLFHKNVKNLRYNKKL